MKNILDKSMKIIIKMFFTIVITFALCKLPAKIAEKIGYMESQKKQRLCGFPDFVRSYSNICRKRS